MSLSWFRRLVKQPKVNRPAQTPRRKPYRLMMEALEDRTVPAFFAPVLVPAGTSEGAVVVGDFNNDGMQDIVVSNLLGISSTVSMLRGNGDGTFQSPVTSPSVAGSWSMVAADFNGDGTLDIAENSVSSSNINVLMGNGNGTFQPAVTYLVGAYCNHLATGDLNGDGTPDIVGASTGYGGTIFVLKNSGTGTFLPASSYSAGVGAQDISIVDLDHDGKPDLMTANQSSVGGIATLKGNGDGTFQSSHSYYAGSAIP
ncbi:MAG: VCBS repeat-containing protein [Gemmatales bacterium]